MNLPPDKVQLLSQYDNEKKWELICDQVGAGKAQLPLLPLLEHPALRMQELAREGPACCPRGLGAHAGFCPPLQDLIRNLRDHLLGVSQRTGSGCPGCSAKQAVYHLSDVHNTWVFVFETESCYIAQAGFKRMLLLPQPAEHQDYIRCGSLCPVA